MSAHWGGSVAKTLLPGASTVTASHAVWVRERSVHHDVKLSQYEICEYSAYILVYFILSIWMHNVYMHCEWTSMSEWVLVGRFILYSVLFSSEADWLTYLICYISLSDQLLLLFTVLRSNVLWCTATVYGTARHITALWCMAYGWYQDTEVWFCVTMLVVLLVAYLVAGYVLLIIFRERFIRWLFVYVCAYVLCDGPCLRRSA